MLKTTTPKTSKEVEDNQVPLRLDKADSGRNRRKSRILKSKTMIIGSINDSYEKEDPKNQLIQEEVDESED